MDLSVIWGNVPSESVEKYMARHLKIHSRLSCEMQNANGLIDARFHCEVCYSWTGVGVVEEVCMCVCDCCVGPLRDVQT